MLTFLKKLFTKNTTEIQQALQQGAIVVDVRTPAEYRNGSIAGSKNIPLNEISSKTGMIKKWGKPIITVCLSGNRSMMAEKILKAAGIEVYNGGAWTTINKLKV